MCGKKTLHLDIKNKSTALNNEKKKSGFVCHFYFKKSHLYAYSCPYTCKCDYK